MAKFYGFFLFFVIFELLTFHIMSHPMPQNFQMNEVETERRIEYNNPVARQNFYGNSPPHGHYPYNYIPYGYAPYGFYPNQPNYVDFNARNQKNFGLSYEDKRLNIGYQQDKQVTAQGASNDQFNKAMDAVFGKQ
ncbi:hypothetical protein PVAND_011074 [Polypedilum vanderplanki]|uniref:Uncharacterized protein n=1 Tax=Polypedilum vanderplanki TaxID=319348 RepID=A0A9J6CI06_POLVA|nr:hypothetical protein PVAND_011074 [Polypedilum vanderplanki]